MMYIMLVRQTLCDVEIKANVLLDACEASRTMIPCVRDFYSFPRLIHLMHVFQHEL